jgi:hypothetical protein
VIKLKSGREWEVGGAGSDIIGISDELEVTVGYDHDNDAWEGHEWNEYVVPLTTAEKSEVCDLMIDRWQRLKAKLLKSES